VVVGRVRVCYLPVKVSNGLPSIHLSSSNPNLLAMDLTDSAGLGTPVSPSVSTVDSGMAVDKLNEKFYHQAKNGQHSKFC